MAKKVLKVQAQFLTQGSDRDASDGISETISLGDPGPGAQVLGQNVSWGKGITFRDGNVDWGQQFDISGSNVTSDTRPQLRYSWQMDQADHEWDVLFTIELTLDDGRTYIVFKDSQRRRIGGGNNPSTGTIVLNVPA
jgi:hypothetical protein